MNISYDVEVYRNLRNGGYTSTIASNATYFKALQNVVTWLESELSGDATHITERRNGWDIHYSDHIDTIDIVEYREGGDTDG